MSSDSDDSDDSRKKRKNKKSRQRRRDSDAEYSDDSNSDEENSKKKRDKKPTGDGAARSMAFFLENEYNQLRHAIFHLKRYLVEDRKVRLPTVHLLGQQSGEKLLEKVTRKNPKNKLKWLKAWKEEHLDRAKSRYQLLLQLKADLRCYSRGLSSSKSSKSGESGGNSSSDVELPLEWREAMLHGKNYELLMKEKKKKLDRDYFRKVQLKKQSDEDNKEWEVRASVAASTVQRIFRSRAAYRRIQAMLDDIWEKVWDPVKEGYYYYNRKTDTATWEKPKLLHHEIDGTL
jgi:hypothetical protein